MFFTVFKSLTLPTDNNSILILKIELCPWIPDKWRTNKSRLDHFYHPPIMCSLPVTIH